jgi:outer membrane lipoprotein-sorting protein
MQKRATSVAIPAALILSFVATFGPAPQASAELTGAQVLQRCERTYRSLKSYRGTTRVLTRGMFSGENATYKTHAIVQYVKPGKIRVEGALMDAAGPFAFVSDGRSTWQTAIGEAGVWEQAQSVEMAIATFTRVSLNAATTIPTILVGTQLGGLLSTLRAVNISNAIIDHKPTYRVDATGPTGNATIWIDRKTFLLAKIHRRENLERLSTISPPSAGEERQALPAGHALDITETFTGVRTNRAIPASRFTRPVGVAIEREMNPSGTVQPAKNGTPISLPQGLHASQHFLQRMRERGISEQQVVDVITAGRRFYDPKNDSHIRWKDGVYVALAPGGVIKTVIRGPIERRWRSE